MERETGFAPSAAPAASAARPPATHSTRLRLPQGRLFSLGGEASDGRGVSRIMREGVRVGRARTTSYVRRGHGSGGTTANRTTRLLWTDGPDRPDGPDGLERLLRRMDFADSGTTHPSIAVASTPALSIVHEVHLVHLVHHTTQAHHPPHHLCLAWPQHCAPSEPGGHGGPCGRNGRKTLPSMWCTGWSGKPDSLPAQRRRRAPRDHRRPIRLGFASLRAGCSAWEAIQLGPFAPVKP